MYRLTISLDQFKMKHLWTTSVMLSASFMLAACGNSQVEAPEEAAEGPKTLIDGLGNEVQIPSNPEKVLGSYLEDYLVSLDVTPVAQWSVSDGESIQDYLQEDLSGVPLIPHDLPYESVLEYEPDLMIIRDAVEQDMYEQYAQIAPTYVLKSSPTEWRETLTEVGEVLGMEGKAESVLETYDAKAQEKAEELSAVADSESAAAVWMVNNSLFVVHPERSSGAVMYGDRSLIYSYLKQLKHLNN